MINAAWSFSLYLKRQRAKGENHVTLASFLSSSLPHITITHSLWPGRAAIIESCSLPSLKSLFSVPDEIWSVSRPRAPFHRSSLPHARNLRAVSPLPPYLAKGLGGGGFGTQYTLHRLTIRIKQHAHRCCRRLSCWRGAQATRSDVECRLIMWWS